MELTAAFLPKLNASLNAIAAFFLVLGFFAIKNQKILWHRIFMSTAFLVSALFLGFYLYYHFNFPSQRFQGQGLIRVFYFSMLLSHVILAVVILPFILRLFFLAFKERFLEHKRLARIIWPLWIYTSVTGVLIYFFLYEWFPSNGASL